MRLSAPIYVLKRQAKALARERGIALHAALDHIAANSGFRNWSHLASSHVSRPAEEILRQLRAGDVMLLGARLGQGKTLLGLELAYAAARAGRKAYFFTLDFNENDVLGRLQTLGIDPKSARGSLVIDTSDDICADHIIDRMGEPEAGTLVVIDYLQLLDQKRANPAVGAQIVKLRTHAQSSGAIMVAISQIDRRFDLDARAMPGLKDVRLPNPIDLALFNKTCFINDGEIQFEQAA